MELSSLNAVQTRTKTPALKEGEQPVNSCCRKEKNHPNKLHDVEIVEEDSDQERVKVHYTGYGSKYDEWRSSDLPTM